MTWETWLRKNDIPPPAFDMSIKTSVSLQSVARALHSASAFSSMERSAPRFSRASVCEDQHASCLLNISREFFTKGDEPLPGGRGGAHFSCMVWDYN